MKRSVLLFLAMMLGVTELALAADPAVRIDPRKSVVQAGDTFTVAITLTRFPSTQGGGVNLRYNPAVVRPTQVDVDSSTWSFYTNPGVINELEGEISDIIFTDFSGVSGESAVATITFTALKKGKTRLKLSESTKNPFAADGRPIAVKFSKGIVKVRKKRKNRH